jgi:hypothetical protein
MAAVSQQVFRQKQLGDCAMAHRRWEGSEGAGVVVMVVMGGGGTH